MRLVCTRPAVAKAMLTEAVNARVGSDALATLAAGDAAVEVTTFKDGKETGGLNAAIPPTAVPGPLLRPDHPARRADAQLHPRRKREQGHRDDPDHRQITTLISGKVLAMFSIGLVQILIVALPLVIAYVFFRDQVRIPDLNLAALVSNPVPMIIGALLLIGGFALFTTTLVAIGAAMPTAKEAGNFMGVMMALIFVLFSAISMIFSNAESLIVQVFPYFPFSSPRHRDAPQRPRLPPHRRSSHRHRDTVHRPSTDVPPRGKSLPVRFHLLHLRSQHPHSPTSRQKSRLTRIHHRPLTDTSQQSTCPAAFSSFPSYRPHAVAGLVAAPGNRRRVRIRCFIRHRAQTTEVADQVLQRYLQEKSKESR